jgi:hypothetical protein
MATLPRRPIWLLQPVAVSRIDQNADAGKSKLVRVGETAVNTRDAGLDLPLSERFCHSWKRYAKEATCGRQLSSGCFRS